MAFEIAEREPDPAQRRAWMTFVIVGGRPDRRRAGRHAGGGVAPDAGSRLPPHQHGIGASDSGRGRARGSCPPTPKNCRSAARDAARESSGSRYGPACRSPEIDADGVSDRPRADPCADGDLGCGRGRVALGTDAGRAARSSRAGAGRARPDDSRPRQCLRASATWLAIEDRRRARAGRRARGHAGGPARRAENIIRGLRGQPRRPVSLSSTRECWRPSAAAPRSPGSGRSRPRASSRGSSGCSSTSSS